MRVLLIGEYYSKNLGDPVLCQTVERTILGEFSDAQVIPFDMSGRTGFDSYYKSKNYFLIQSCLFRLAYQAPMFLKRFPLCRIIRKDIYRYIRTMSMLDSLLTKESFDLAVFAGGSIFMDHFAGVIYGIIKRCERKEIPVIFHACGMSHLSDDSVYVLQKALNSKTIKAISLRDSYQRFQSLFHVQARVTETFDTALACSKFYQKSQKTVADIGVGIIGIPAYFDFQKEIVRTIQQSGLKWRVFTNGALHDYEMALRILSDLGISESERDNYILNSPEKAEELIRNVTCFRQIISFRMHSQIIATSYGIPSVGFIWDNKIRDFYSKIGLPNNCMNPDGVVLWEEIKYKLSMDAGILRDRALKAGESSQHALVQQIKQL